MEMRSGLPSAQCMTESCATMRSAVMISWMLTFSTVVVTTLRQRPVLGLMTAVDADGRVADGEDTVAFNRGGRPRVFSTGLSERGRGERGHYLLGGEGEVAPHSGSVGVIVELLLQACVHAERTFRRLLFCLIVLVKASRLKAKTGIWIARLARWRLRGSCLRRPGG